MTKKASETIFQYDFWTHEQMRFYDCFFFFSALEFLFLFLFNINHVSPCYVSSPSHVRSLGWKFLLRPWGTLFDPSEGCVLFL